MWSSMLKAAWTWADGNAEDEGIKTCAESLVKVLLNIAGSLTTRGKAAESEAILREALQVCHVSNFFVIVMCRMRIHKWCLPCQGMRPVT